MLNVGVGTEGATSGGISPNSSRVSSSFLNFKCCAVGDSGVGKTSMLMAYCVGDWRPNRGFIPPTYVPSRPFIIPCADSNTCITLTIKDTRGGTEMDQLRAYDCSGADCLLVCFSVVDIESFFNVEARWLPLMAKLCPEAACVLVGTKTDLRQPQQQHQQQQSRQRQSTLSADISEDGGGGGGGRNSRRSSAMEVTAKMGWKLAKKIRAFQYLECSSMDKDSLDAVFNAAIRTFTDEPPARDGASCPGSNSKDKTDSAKKCTVS